MTDWEAIVRQHGETVSRTALRILGRSAEVEDVCQEVFFEAYRFQQSSRVDNWGAFLCRLATLRSLDRLRKRKPTTPLTGSEISSTNSDPLNAVIAEELAVRLRHSLAQLPPQQAAVFSLRYFEAMTNAEIASTLEISSSAVSTALGKARTALAAALNHVTQGEVK
jgi:RNA polymerase sigma-70 factor (ECF subfamily)